MLAKLEYDPEIPQTPLEKHVQMFLNGLKELGITSTTVFLYCDSTEPFNKTRGIKALGDELKGSFHQSQFLNVKTDFLSFSTLMYSKGESNEIVDLIQKEAFKLISTESLDVNT